MVVLKPFDKVRPHGWLDVFFAAHGEYGLHDFLHISIDNGLFGQGYGSDESIVKGDKLLLEIEGSGVPPDQSGFDNVGPKKIDGSSVSDGASVLDHIATSVDETVKPVPKPQVEPSEIKLTDVPCIVHVKVEVNVMSGADGVNPGFLQGFEFGLEVGGNLGGH